MQNEVVGVNINMADLQILQWFVSLLRKKCRKGLERSKVSRRCKHWQRMRRISLEYRQRNNAVLASMFVILLYGFVRERRIRSFHKPSQSYWEGANRYWTDRMWVENLRMRKTTFDFICNQLQPLLIKKNTCFRRAIAVEARVAIALWCLATGMDYRSLGQLFGVGRCTCCKVTHVVCLAIVNVLLTRFMKVARGERLEDVKENFVIKSGLRQFVGAVDGCHTPIIPPKDYHADYYNRKGVHSVLLQGIVDDKCRQVF